MEIKGILSQKETKYEKRNCKCEIRAQYTTKHIEMVIYREVKNEIISKSKRIL